MGTEEWLKGNGLTEWSPPCGSFVVGTAQRRAWRPAAAGVCACFAFLCHCRAAARLSHHSYTSSREYFWPE